jgi:hypothetical protein
MPKKTSSSERTEIQRQADAAPRVRKENPCRDDLQCPRVVEELHKRMVALRNLPCPNVDGVRMIDSITAATVSYETTAQDVTKRNETPSYVNDKHMTKMLDALIVKAAGVVCPGGCASQHAHDQDQKEHPGTFRQCPK